MKIIKIKYLFALVWIFLFYTITFEDQFINFLYNFCSNNSLIAPLALILLQTFFASLGLPCSPLSILAGILWGFVYGVLYSILATLVASSFTFILGRYVLNNKFMIANKFPIFKMISGLIHQHKWKVSAVAHANPIFPGSSLGYVFGGSDISFQQFFIGVIIGTMPLQLLVVALGNFFKGYLSVGAKSIAGIIIIFILLILYKIIVPKLLKNFSFSIGNVDN